MKKYMSILLAAVVAFVPLLSLVSCAAPVPSPTVEAASIHRYRMADVMTSSLLIIPARSNSETFGIFGETDLQRIFTSTPREDLPDTFPITVQNVTYTAQKSEYSALQDLDDLIALQYYYYESITLSETSYRATYDLYGAEGEKRLGSIWVYSDGTVNLRLSTQSRDAERLTKQQCIDIAKQELVSQGVSLAHYDICVYSAAKNKESPDYNDLYEVYFTKKEEACPQSDLYFVVPNYDIMVSVAPTGQVRSIECNPQKLLHYEPRAEEPDYEKAMSEIIRWFKDTYPSGRKTMHDIKMEAIPGTSFIYAEIAVVNELHYEDIFRAYLFPVDEQDEPIFAKGGR